MTSNPITEETLAELERVDAEYASCKRTVEDAGHMDNYKDAARALDLMQELSDKAREHIGPLVAEVRRLRNLVVYARDASGCFIGSETAAGRACETLHKRLSEALDG